VLVDHALLPSTPIDRGAEGTENVLLKNIISKNSNIAISSQEGDNVFCDDGGYSRWARAFDTAAE